MGAEYSKIQQGKYVENCCKKGFSLNKPNKSVYEDIEASMPFKTMQLCTFEARLKKYTYNGKTISMNQLKSAFKNDPEWIKALNDETSNLYCLIDG